MTESEAIQCIAFVEDIMLVQASRLELSTLRVKRSLLTFLENFQCQLLPQLRPLQPSEPLHISSRKGGSVLQHRRHVDVCLRIKAIKVLISLCLCLLQYASIL